MTVLQHTYRKNGYTYVLVERNEHAAVYAQMKGDRIAAYEVGYVKTRSDATIGDKFIEGGECFWGNEDFGVIAWSILSREKAFARMGECTTKAQLPKP